MLTESMSGKDARPVVEDLSTYVLGGRMQYIAGHGWQTPGGVYTDRVPIIDQALEAERIGFRRIWLSERLSVKDAAVTLGAAAAVTKRIGVATGAVAAPARLPIVNASMGATINASFGPRFVLGLGRGLRQVYPGYGMPDGGEATYRHLLDHAQIIRRLWRGESVTYSGPAGNFENMRMSELPPVAPEIWFVSLGGPKASRVAADPVFDGHLLTDLLNPGATAKSVAWTREECGRIGRDPATLRICQCVITAPDCTEAETHELAHARAVLALGYDRAAEMFIRLNDWDPAVVEKIRNHRKDQVNDVAMDLRYHRSELTDLIELLPEEWMQQAAAIGSVADCVQSLERFRHAGADEIAVYGSTPAQNASLVEAWRNRIRS